MTNIFLWNGKPVAFNSGETVASALHRSGHLIFGMSPTGQNRSVFCGIGQCQSCLVEDEQHGEVEACLLLCKRGMRLFSSGIVIKSREAQDD